ncbi:MAG TPA: hypothetical protein VK335_10910 [Bryobacteraceae bacterium]|nr:hypothetical protein [Bryobacteraceae bacterium]
MVEALTAAIVALNAAVVAPWPTVTDPGILTLAVLPDTARPTLRLPLGAAADVVTVHDTLPGVVRGLGEQDSAFNVTGGGGGGANWRAKLCELPFNVATNVAVVEALTAPIVALNAEVVAPWPTVTDPGILTLPVLPDTARPTLKPPLGAAADVVTVHDTLPGVVRGFGEHANAVSVTGGGGGGANWSAKLCELPFKVATNDAVVEALTAAAVALNVAVVAPWAMVTAPGSLTPAAPPETPRATLSPPLGAGADAVTVHDAVPGVVSGLGEQDSAVNVTGWVIVTVPPVAVTASRLPAASVPEGLVICTPEDLFVVVDESVKVIVATTPLLIVFSFNPKSRQLIDPAPVPHDTDLPAAVATGPAATLMEAKSIVE